jgi:DNA-binding Lrp family transcriptional regulator
VQETEKKSVESVLSNTYGDDHIAAIIHLKVDTKDVFLVTGDTDIVVKTKFQNYNQLKRFLVEDISAISGVRDTKTLMVVTTFKERGAVRIEEDGA